MDLEMLRHLFGNAILWTAAFAYAAAQTIKTLVYYKKHKKINLYTFISSGGFPSSHSAFVMAATASIGFIEGFESSLFAMSAIISLIVMYDAAGVRRAAGNQAAAINKLFKSLENHGVSLDKALKELLGHTPVQVFVGAILGIVVGLFA